MEISLSSPACGPAALCMPHSSALVEINICTELFICRSRENEHEALSNDKTPKRRKYCELRRRRPFCDDDYT